MEEDQEKFLEDAKKVVREQAYFMKKAIDSKNMRDALKFSSKMIGELGTSALSPKTYYILYMQIFDELRVLENYFKEDYKMGRRLSDLYESVQHAQNVLPRLYLLVTVGAVYIQSHEVKARDILFDLLEMVKAVQHPLRGLFLRYYFLKMCKDKLPDKDNEYAEDGGDINDSISCISSNLAEMNKLWIRMQSGKEKSRRERERIDLKVTVGENLHRLSSLEGVNLEIYKNVVLPRLLDLITNSKDIISQEYLIDCIIQTFPDEFHLHTLQILLNAISTGLQPNVDLKMIFIHLMDRLAEFALNTETSVESFNQDLNIFAMFKDSIKRIIDENSANMELKKFLDLEVAFLKFALRCYPKNSDYVNQILKDCVVICEKQLSKDFADDCQNNIVKFLTMPLETMSLTILQMNEYPNLMKYLPFAKRRLVAAKICQAVVNLRNVLSNVPLTEQLIKFINPLLVTEKDYVEVEPFEFEEEQLSVAKLIHLVNGESIAATLELLNLFKKKFLEGEAKRMKFTLPSLIFALFRVIREVAHSEGKLGGAKDLIKEVKKLIDLLAKDHHELSLRLLLNLALCINEADREKELDEFTYEVISQAMLIYQDELGDSDSKLRALQLIISTIEHLSCLSPENYDVLITNATQYSAKLLKKNEQCLSVLQCTHLFFNQSYRNDQRVFECFKRCLKLADICLNSNVTHLALYVSILNKFGYYLSNDCQTIKLGDVQECINLIKGRIGEVKDKETVLFWNSTKIYLQEKKQKGVKTFVGLEI